MSECCDEHNCRRKHPMHIQYAELSGRWYVVTRWKQRSGRPDGFFTAVERHELTGFSRDMLEEMREAWLEKYGEDDELTEESRS